MAKFVEVPAAAIEQPLQALGFRRVCTHGQVVYIKEHDCCRNVLVKVYTSIPYSLVAPAGAEAVRRAGKDSIRVCCAYESSVKNFGIGKFPYIARVGTVEGVVQRMLETVKAAWVRGQDWFDGVQVKQVMSA
jgi:hypothetical protein